MPKNVLSLPTSSLPLSTAAGGTEVVVSVDWAEGAGEVLGGAGLAVRSEAGPESPGGGVAIPPGGGFDVMPCRVIPEQYQTIDSA